MKLKLFNNLLFKKYSLAEFYVKENIFRLTKVFIDFSAVLFSVCFPTLGMIHFSNFIRRLRIEKDYTQDYMAMRLDMSVSAYSKLERGQTDPPLSRIIKIAEILEFDLTEYFVWRKQESGNNIVKENNENSSYRYVTKREFSEVLIRIEKLEQLYFRLEGK